MTGRRKTTGKPLAREAAAQRRHKLIEARLLAASGNPAKRVAIAAGAVQAALRNTTDVALNNKLAGLVVAQLLGHADTLWDREGVKVDEHA